MQIFKLYIYIVFFCDLYIISFHYIYLPFAPFNKCEKIGKVCDFTLQIAKPQTNQASTVNTKPVEEETEFFVVEGKSAPKSKATTYQKRRPMHRVNAQSTNPAFDTSKKPIQQKSNYARNYVQRTKFKESILVKSDWTYIHDISKVTADKTTMSGLPQSQVIAQTGTIKEYDISYDKTNPKSEKPIAVKDGPWTASLSTTSDYLFLELIEKDTESNIKDPVLYATDSILTSLMTLKHSNFPWEMIVNKTDNFIVLDKPEKASQSYIDLMTSSENTTGPLPEEEKVIYFI